MKVWILLIALTTWASASVLPTDNNMIYFEFDKPAQTPEELQRQSKLIEMIMPELSKVLPKVMQKPQPPKQQRPVEYYYMEPMEQPTKLMPQPPMQKKSLQRVHEQVVMQSLPMVLQMIAEEHSTPQEMPISAPPPLPPPPMMMHGPQPPKPFLEPPHYYMKQFEEPQPPRHMQQPPMHPPMFMNHHQAPMMHPQMMMNQPMMYNMPAPHPYHFTENQFAPQPPPMFRHYPIYEFHPPMVQHPNMWYNPMSMRQPMMGPEYYYW